jgi:hypothetical protein
MTRVLSVTVFAAGMLGSCRAPAPPPPPPHSFEAHVPVTRADSVAATGVRVYDLIRLVDRLGRPDGAPPATLAPVLEHYEYAHGTDLWGRGIRYRSEGRWYEVRSAGPDGTFHSADDVVGWGRIGLIDPCELRNEYRVVVKNETTACAGIPPVLRSPGS